jgi:hypothetical protein
METNNLKAKDIKLKDVELKPSADLYDIFRFGVEIECLLVVPAAWIREFDPNDRILARIQFFKKIMTKWNQSIGPEDYRLVTEIKELQDLNEKPVFDHNGENKEAKIFFTKTWTMTEDPTVLPDNELIKQHPNCPICKFI